MSRGEWTGQLVGLGFMVFHLTEATMYCLGRRDGSIPPDDDDFAEPAIGAPPLDASHRTPRRNPR